jgi:flagellar hook-associated protein 1 FlgK
MSLNTSLSIAVQSLLADTGALQSVNNNIANAKTPGYSRQTVVLQSAAPTNEGTISLGNGVVLQGFQSVRSEILQTQIQQQTQAQSGANAQLSTLQQIQPAFTTSTQDIGTQMTAFFTTVSSLSTNPTNTSLRQGVITSAQNLASAFNTVSASLTSTQAALNTTVTQDVTQINQLTKQIAALNPQIVALKNSGQDGGVLQDQQNQLVLQLSALTNVAITQTDNGNTLTTGNGTPLVVGSESFALSTTIGSDGMTHILDNNGTDVTATLSRGDLGGTIITRDTTIPTLITQLNTVASQFGTAINAAQAKGFDQFGNAGAALFSNTASAATISLATTDPTSIAASSDAFSGSNGNLTNLAAVQTNALPSGDTPIDTYSNIVFNVGTLTAQATAESSATTTSLLQLNDQNSAISGVSIDEESTNLIRYQQAYEAAARVVSTISSLFDVTMSMGTNAAS